MNCHAALLRPVPLKKIGPLIADAGLGLFENLLHGCRAAIAGDRRHGNGGPGIASEADRGLIHSIMTQFRSGLIDPDGETGLVVWDDSRGTIDPCLDWPLRPVRERQRAGGRLWPSDWHHSEVGTSPRPESATRNTRESAPHPAPMPPPALAAVGRGGCPVVHLRHG